MLGVLAGIEPDEVNKILDKHKGNIRESLKEAGVN
jgi:hypothetical protein